MLAPKKANLSEPLMRRTEPVRITSWNCECSGRNSAFVVCSWPSGAWGSQTPNERFNQDVKHDVQTG
jgi:hypothetical protein